MVVIMWKYRGGGFIPGVPARDLTSEEASRFGEQLLEASGLYERPKKSGSMKPRPSENKADLPESEDKD